MTPKSPTPSARRHVAALMALIPSDQLAPIVHGPAIQSLALVHASYRGPQPTPSQSMTAHWWRVLARARWLQIAPLIHEFNQYLLSGKSKPKAAPKPPSAIYHPTQGWIFDGEHWQVPAGIAKLYLKFLGLVIPDNPPQIARIADYPCLYPEGQTPPAFSIPPVTPIPYSLGVHVMLEFSGRGRELVRISSDRPMIVGVVAKAPNSEEGRTRAARYPYTLTELPSAQPAEHLYFASNVRNPIHHSTKY